MSGWVGENGYMLFVIDFNWIGFVSLKYKELTIKCLWYTHRGTSKNNKILVGPVTDQKLTSFWFIV